VVSGSRWAVQLAGLCAFAIAQPVFDVLNRHPEFFIAHDVSPADLTGITVVIFLVPPVLLFSIERVVSLADTRSGRMLQSGFVALLVAIVTSQLALRALGLGEREGLALAGSCGLLVALVYQRNATTRRVAWLLGLLSPVFPIAFLLQAAAPSPDEAMTTEEPAQTERAADVPVIVLVFDEFPLLSMVDADNQIDAARLPAFAGFARSATWFRNTTSVSDGTSLAVPAILTGRRPRTDRKPDFASHPQNLFTLLAPTHRLDVRESLTRLCPEHLCETRRPQGGATTASLFLDLSIVAGHVIAPPSLSRRLPPIDDRWEGFTQNADDLPAAEIFADFARGIGNRGLPTLDYLHILLPHGPWQHLPSGQRYGSEARLRRPHGLDGLRWAANPLFGKLALQRHLLEVGYVDRLFGEFIRSLKTRGLYDAALIIVVADHGISFSPATKWRALDDRNAAELMAVPFFVKAPHQEVGRIVDRNVETIDVFPTIAEQLGIEIPWPVDGRSAFDVTLPERPSKRALSFYSRRERVFGPSLEDYPRALAERFDRIAAGELYRVGPHPELLGRSPPADRSAGEDELRRATIDLDDPTAFDEVDPAAPWLPVYVSGRIDAVDAPPEPLAITLAGVVRATAMPFLEKGEWRFVAILPPDVLTQGRSPLGLWWIETEGAEQSLIRAL